MIPAFSLVWFDVNLLWDGIGIMFYLEFELMAGGISFDVLHILLVCFFIYHVCIVLFTILCTKQQQQQRY